MTKLHGKPDAFAIAASDGSRSSIARRCRRRRPAVAATALLLFFTHRARASPTTPEPPVVVLGPPPPLAAPPDPPPAPAPAPIPLNAQLETSISGTMFPAALGDLRFTGSGVPLGSGRRSTFSHLGRELGLRNPTFWGGELGIGYRQRYFGVIVSGMVAGNASADATPTNRVAAHQVGTGSVTAYGGGIELFGSVPLDRFTLSIGAVAGLRGFSMPLVGFEPTTCTSSRKSGRQRYPCPERATTNATPYVQPRVRLDVAVTDDRTLFLGVYLGIDALGDRSMLTGVMLGLRLPKIGS